MSLVGENSHNKTPAPGTNRIDYTLIPDMTKKAPWLKVILLFLLTIRLQAQEPIAPDRIFSPEQLKADIHYLRNKLETREPNLWLYTSRSVMNQYFDSLESSVTVPMTGRDFYNHISSLASLIKDGHTLILPDKAITDYYRQHVSFFPFEIVTEADRIFIVMNFSADTSISPGTEILSVNGLSSHSVTDRLMKRMVRDGYNEAYPRWILNNYFRSYYGFSLGFPDSFQLQLRSPGGLISTKTIAAVPYHELNARKTDRYPAIAARANNEKGISYSFDSVKQVAYLKILSWHNNILKKQYHQHFRKEIRQFINSLEKSNSKNLVIDLRDNQGGNGENGIYLLQRLLDKPFTYFRSIKKRKGSLQDTARLVNSMKRLTRTWQPARYTFNGKVFVLTNGGSFSNSGIFASVIQEQKRGLIAGTETGGNNVILSGGENYCILPNSRVHVFKATHQMIIATEKKNTGRGVIPDIAIQPTLQDQLQHKDVILETVLGLITR